MNLLQIFLFFALIGLSFEDCAANEIDINPIGGNCKAIVDVIGEENLEIDLDLLQYLASIKIIQKNNYKLKFYNLNDDDLQSRNLAKSNLYIPQKCMDAMAADPKIKLDKNKGIVIIVYNGNKINRNNIPENYFVIRHTSDGSQAKYINSKYYDLSLCHEDPILMDEKIGISELRYTLDDDTPIDIDKIMYAKKLKIDLFDPHSDFLNDICYAFTSEYGTDVTLESRLEDYYQNITLCDESASSHYIEFNYSKTDKTIIYRCAYGFYENEEEKQSYIENIDSKINVVFTSSNIKVITCFSELFNVRNMVTNYGFLICFVTLIIQIILYINFCCKGTKPLEEQIKEMAESVDNQNINKTTVNINPNSSGNNTNDRFKDQKDEIGIGNQENTENVENIENIENIENNEENEENNDEGEKGGKKKEEKKEKKSKKK